MQPPPPLPPISTRAHPRIRFATPVQVSVGARSFICNTEDISLGGLGATHPQPPPALTKLRLLFNLPNGSSVHTDAIVRYVRADRFGVQFLDLPSVAHQALDDYTRRTLGYTRRGSRIAVRLTVTLQGEAPASDLQMAETVVLSHNGGLLVCRAHFKVGDVLRLTWPEQNRSTRVRIAFQRPCGPGELTELGFEFLDSADFWQIAALS